MLDQPFALAPADQQHLTAITRRGRTKARTFQRASALLQLQAGTACCRSPRRSTRSVGKAWPAGATAIAR
jgi:hypothetical protein